MTAAVALPRALLHELRRRPTYEELIGTIEKDFPLRLPSRRALQIEASPELQELRDSLDATNVYLKAETRKQEVAARVREAAAAHGVAAMDLTHAATPPPPPPPAAAAVMDLDRTAQAIKRASESSGGVVPVYGGSETVVAADDTPPKKAKKTRPPAPPFSRVSHRSPSPPQRASGRGSSSAASDILAVRMTPLAARLAASRAAALGGNQPSTT